MASPITKLEYRILGQTGLQLSFVGFGASPLGRVFGPVSEDDGIASVREAFRLGINFFDTSPYLYFLHPFLFSVNFSLMSLKTFIFVCFCLVTRKCIERGEKRTFWFSIIDLLGFLTDYLQKYV